MYSKDNNKINTYLISNWIKYFSKMKFKSSEKEQKLIKSLFEGSVNMINNIQKML